MYFKTIRAVIEYNAHQFAQSAVQRRPPDSYGKSGQGETLQACRSGSPHAPWKAGGRSGTERPILPAIPFENRMLIPCFEIALYRFNIT